MHSCHVQTVALDEGECRGALKISSRRLRVKAELASSLPPVLLIIVPFHPMPWLNPCKTIRASISHMAALTLFPCHRTTLPRLAFILQISSSTVGECMCACTPHILFFFAPPFFSGRLIRITITGMWLRAVLSQWQSGERESCPTCF